SYVGTARTEATEVTLGLEPFESCFVVFGPAGEEPMIADTDLPGALQIARTATGIQVRGWVTENREYFLTHPGGREHRISVRDLPTPAAIAGPWTIRLGDHGAIQTAQLKSWTEFPEGQGYSGWATYETSFQVKRLAEHIEWLLDLGRVHETAEAELNGTPLGAAWKGSRRLSTRSALRLGHNRLTIRVAN